MLRIHKYFTVKSLAFFFLLSMFPLHSLAIKVADIATTPSKKIIDLGGLKPLKKATKIAVPGYRLIFVVGGKAVARSENWLGSGGGATGSRATMVVSLGNVDYALMQSIADEAYAQFMVKIKELGLEIVPLETVKASQSYQKLDLTPNTPEKPYGKDYLNQNMIVVTPTSLPLWFTHVDGPIGDKGPFNQSNTKLMPKMAEELDAVVLYPTLKIDFATSEGSGRSKLDSKAEVSVKARLRVAPEHSYWWSGNNKGLTAAAMKDGVGTDEDFGSFVEDKSGSERGGFGNFKYSKEVVVLEAEPETYKRLSLEVLAGVTDAFKLAVEEIRK